MANVPDLSPQAAAELERIAKLEGVPVQEVARLILEDFAHASACDAPGWCSPPDEPKWRLAARRGLVAVTSL
jgi:hypothetical protein